MEAEQADAAGYDDDQVAVAYDVLLQQPGLDMESFARTLGRTEDEIRPILDRLADLALLHHRASEYGSFEAVSPFVAIYRLLAREHSILTQRSRFLQHSYKTFSSIILKYPVSGADAPAKGAIEELADLPSIRRRVEELAFGATDEVLSFSPPTVNPAAARAASGPLDLTVLKRGARMRILYTDRLAFDSAELAHARELVDAGAEIRVAPEVPMRLIVVDRQVAMVPRNPERSADGALVVRHEAILVALVALFEACWRGGRTLPGAADWTPPCSAGEQAVLGLLATGAKDDAVARNLGMSVRTVRRIIADLMDRAGAGSRFELGVHAMQQGWLS